ncbi:MAG: hypothetical protein ACYTFG_14075, partial [Planctomycetota bacterium]
AVVVGSPILAQEPGDKPPKKEDPAAGPEGGGEGEKPEGGGKDPKAEEPKIADELKKAREYAKAPDQRVEVILKRGTVFEGIARRGVLAEERRLVKVEGEERLEQLYAPIHWKKVLKPGKKDGRRILVPTEPKAAPDEKKKIDWNKVGIRIWFFRQTRGFVFIPYRDVEQLQVVRVLSYRDSKKLFRSIEEQEKKLLNAEKQARDDEKERSKVRKEFESESREKELARRRGLDATAAEEAKKRRKELMKKFPPGEKWNREKKTQIMVRMIQGINPSPEEKEFYRVFDEWLKAKEDEEFVTGK